VVYKSDGSTHIFKQSSCGFHYMTLGKNLLHSRRYEISAYSQSLYKHSAISKELQRKIGRPSTPDIINITEANLLKNCLVTKQDMLIAEDIFGPIYVPCK